MMVKQVIIALFISVTLFTACSKSNSGGRAPCQPATVASEKNAMVTYCVANGINYQTDSSGILYQIITPGTGATPNLNSKIYITYTGKLLNGTTFDMQTNASQTGWTLNSLIQGWQIALLLIKKGGEIKIVIPSALAYGCIGSGPIPSNAPLFFDITLVDVQ
ncbi:FKBP-type peptidyl-prolyl cis-trans isomerase [Hydrotalea sp.]|uniref:FKBP-type peptidyl-prolyl cis-trans isomerase n=1 Tax=Hydrotalea sp. TaxID=2881279 RepID=UPI00261C94C4|nr:FKBP-type peptidyl-prolyl cis-trans isomerase [Hydrotalea sp.]